MSERLQSDLLAQQDLAQRVNVFVCGVTCWHFLTTLQYVELPLLRGRLKPRWTMIPYFGARYSLVGSTIGFQLNLCGPANETFWFVGSVAMIFASEILLLRALTLWRNNIYATVFLIFCGVGHWALGIIAFLVPLIYAWIKFASTCQIFFGPTGPVPFFLYTMLLDLTVLIATVVALYRMREARASSPLRSRLYKHGFIYFILTFVVNLLIFVFACTMVNAFLADVFTPPSVTLSVIASSYAYISLLHLHSDDRSPIVPPISFRPAKSATYELTTNFFISAPTMRDSGEVAGPVVIYSTPSPRAPPPLHILEMGIIREPRVSLAQPS